MEQLNYAHEVRDIDEVPAGEGEATDAELKLAIQLIEQIASDSFDPAEYDDEVGQRMLAAIEKKVADGKEITAPAEEEAPAQVIDLMEALKASVAKAGDAGGKGGRKPAKRTKSQARAKKAAGAE